MKIVKNTATINGKEIITPLADCGFSLKNEGKESTLKNRANKYAKVTAIISAKTKTAILKIFFKSFKIPTPKQ